MRVADFRSDPETLRAVPAGGPAALFDLGIYARRYKLIAATALAAVVLGALVGVFKPSSYTAKVSLLIGARLGQSGPIAAEGERRSYGAKVQQLLARRARLQAEITGANEITFPPELARDDPSTAAILDGEKQLFAARRRTLDESMEKFRQDKALAEQRVSSLMQQARLAAVQQRSIDKEVDELRSLVERKLAPTPRLGDMQRTAATIASHKVEIESEVARTEQAKNQADQRVTEARNQRRSETLAELQITEAELRDYTMRRETLRAVAASSVADQKFDSGMLANQAEIITSDGLVRKVAQRLNLHQDPAFAGPRAAEATGEARLSNAVAALQTSLTAVRVGPGSRLDISYKARDPNQAARIANAVAETYVDGQSEAAARASEERLSAGSGDAQPGATVLRAAEPPLKPDGPGLLSICAAALVLGLAAGLAVAAGAELLARSKKAAVQAQQPERPIRSPVFTRADRALPVRRIL